MQTAVKPPGDGRELGRASNRYLAHSLHDIRYAALQIDKSRFVWLYGSEVLRFAKIAVHRIGVVKGEHRDAVEVAYSSEQSQLASVVREVVLVVRHEVPCEV